MFRISSLLLPLVLIGCSYGSHRSPEASGSPQAVSTPPPDGLLLQTDRDDYLATPEKSPDKQRAYGFTIIARFENRTQNPIFLDRCYPHSPNRYMAFRWPKEAKNRSVPTIGSGHVLVMTIRLSWSRAKSAKIVCASQGRMSGRATGEHTWTPLRDGTA